LADRDDLEFTYSLIDRLFRRREAAAQQQHAADHEADQGEPE